MSYHARVGPASTKSNAIPLEKKREKRNDVGWKFMFWKQIHEIEICEDKEFRTNLGGRIKTLAFDAAAACKKAEKG